MKVFALLPCDTVNVDASTGKHFIFGHYSSIKVNTFPAKHPNITFFIGLTDIAEGEHTYQLRFGLPSNLPPAPPAPKKVFPWDPPPPPPPADPVKTYIEQKFTSKGANERLYFISQLNDLVFDKEGAYLLRVMVDGEEAASTKMNVGK